MILVWFFVGRAIDNRGEGRASARKMALGAKSFLRIVLMLLGVLLLLVGITPLLDNRGFTNPSGARAASVLWFVWFLILFFLPGVDLLRELRAKRLRANPVA